MSDYIRLGKTFATDKVIKPQVTKAFNEESYDMSIIGGPKDVKGGAEEGC